MKQEEMKSHFISDQFTWVTLCCIREDIFLKGLKFSIFSHV